MSDKPIIQIDDDWKRQAQEEKRKLAEQQQARPAAAAPAPAAPRSAPREEEDSAPAARTMPPPSFATLVQSVMTQALYYLGELQHEGEPPMLSFEMARHQIDTLAILEEKTRGNLAAEEQSLLDQALYDLRSRFVSIAQQYIR